MSFIAAHASSCGKGTSSIRFTIPINASQDDQCLFSLCPWSLHSVNECPHELHGCFEERRFFEITSGYVFDMRGLIFPSAYIFARAARLAALFFGCIIVNWQRTRRIKHIQQSRSIPGVFSSDWKCEGASEFTQKRVSRFRKEPKMGKGTSNLTPEDSQDGASLEEGDIEGD